ncbi:DUF1642 domain-containing protein [Enterococcus faecalis]|uniref:DUF1642 domain-containing protein n=1 Tax=Enterococcus faecalis TaxID=1351 RepID=UPI001F5A1EA5|nr:DUF1642 domain-containing protein [Enterococcus faecalis]
MNKQELIDILENLECSTESLSYDNGYEQGVYDSLSHVILLDEPKKVVVPQVVADWIKYAKQQSYGFMQSYDPKKMFYPINDGLDKWIDNNQETFALAWVNGYEVEKEQLYYVKLPDLRSSSSDNVYGLRKTLNGEIRVGVFDKQEIGKTKESQLTENQIKAVDERYWPFAVKVE